jgi:hypothetical protein
MKEAKVNINDVNDHFSGEVVIEVLKYRDRMRYGQDISFKFDEKGEVIVDNGTYESMGKMIEIAEKHIISVDLVHVKSGVSAKSFEDLEYDPIFDELLPQLATVVFNAGRVGKPSKKK